MIHEGGVRAVQVKRFTMDAAHRGSGLFKQTSGGCIVPEASTTLLQFGELEMATGRALESMTGIEDGTPELGRHQFLQAKGMGMLLEFPQDPVTLGTGLEASVVGEGQLPRR